MLTQLLSQHSEVFIKQIKEWGEILVGWESRNKYAAYDRQKNELCFIAEQGGGLFNVLARLILRSHRPLEVGIFGQDKKLLATLSRPFFFFFSDLNVFDHNKAKLGSVHRRWGIIYKKYDLVNNQGQVFARIKSPLWRLWTFPVLDRTDHAVGQISKRWGGMLREVFTDADAYLCSFGEQAQWSPEEKAVIFAASISIDFDFFEDNQNR